MSNAPDPLVGKVLADRFEIVERIGEGGTGVVYKAKQLSVDRIIAIKVLGAHVSTDPSWVKRFHNEARAASRLDHPNTVRLIDFGQTKEGLLFIAMEFLHGRSLRQEIDRVQKMPANRVLRIVSQMCASLSEAHNQGIIHRDIKPDNVYLVEMKGAGDYVKVLDFSVAKLDTPDAQVTRAGVVFGTPAYMSPEQGRGVPLDQRSDIYAVGIVAYEMVMGKPPFDAKIPTEVVMMHLRDKPPPIVGAPPQLAAIIMKALEKDPGRRQQTAEILDNDCQACFGELFPRQTPGTGMQGVISPAMGTPAAAPPPAAPPPMVSVNPQVAEQKTMMAGMQAPVIGHVAEQKTQMAGMQAPVIGTEQKTQMAGMQAPNIGRSPPPAGSNLPPPPAPPPPSAGYPPSSQAPLADMKTMMAQPAPVIQRPASTAAQQRTMMAQPMGTGPVTAGTQILPDSQGVVAYAQEQARQARELAQPDALPVKPAGALFWLAWIIIGIGAGMGVHFWMAHKAGLPGM